MGPLRTVPVGRARMLARLPRIAFLGAVGILCVLGLRELLHHPATSAVATGPSYRGADVRADALGEAFARALMEGDATESLRMTFGFSDEPLADHRPGRTTIDWSQVVASSPRANGSRVVTVALHGSGPSTYLAVTVNRDGSGRLYVAGPPAIVGPPVVSAQARSTAEVEVQDPALVVVVARVVRHYLAGEATDLDADLAPGAVVSLPATSMRLAQVVATTWVTAARRVAALVLARSRSGRKLTLRYELDVVRLGRRWLVRRVHVNPTAPEASP